MAHGIVEQHGGHTTCESELDKGSTLRIYFPSIERVITAEDIEGNSLSAGKGETVLLVDDEELVRALGERILKRVGYKVITSSNGREALGVYWRKQEEIELVILDLLMPEMGGQQCLDLLLAAKPDLKVLVTSGYSGDTAMRESREMGASGFIAKPFKMKELLRQVRKTLDEAEACRQRENVG